MTVVTAPEAALRLVPGSWWARADFQKGRYGLLPGWASWEERAWAEDALEALRLARKPLRVMPEEEVKRLLAEGPEEALKRLKALV